MDFAGTKRKVSEAHIAEEAGKRGIEPAAIHAIIEVEASRSGFDARGRLKALFEPHKFYKHLGDTPKRAKAVEAGLAYEHWIAGHYPKSADGVYNQIHEACAIDEEAALLSCSWGLGQIMGENFAQAGFNSVHDMVEAFKTGEDAQLDGMLAFIESAGLTHDLKQHAWARFAKGYNGASYRKNNYDKKLANAYGRWAERLGHEQPIDVLAVGSSGAAVKAVQEKLAALGYRPGKADGKFGNLTRDAVMAFQADNGLGTTGRVDNTTAAAIDTGKARPIGKERAEAPAKEVKKASRIAAGGDLIAKAAGTAGAAGVAVQGAADSGAIDWLSKITSHADTFKSVVTTAQEVGSFAGQHLPYAMGVALMAVAYVAYRHVVLPRIEDHRKGATL